MNLEILVEEPSAERALAQLVPKIVGPRHDVAIYPFRNKTEMLAKITGRLEAWFLGDMPALRAAYPRLPAGLEFRAKYRDPDAVAGGTWEALEHLLQRYGYFPTRLAKTVAAAEIARHTNVETNRSGSFQAFRDGLRRLVGEEPHA
jgi:uncharacterized protein DUF4276